MNRQVQANRPLLDDGVAQPARAPGPRWGGVQGSLVDGSIRGVEGIEHRVVAAVDLGPRARQLDRFINGSGIELQQVSQHLGQHDLGVLRERGTEKRHESCLS